MGDPLYRVRVNIDIPVVFEGKPEDFERPFEVYREAAMQRVRDLLPPMVEKAAYITTVRTVGGERIYDNGLDYDGREPDGIRTGVPK